MVSYPSNSIPERDVSSPVVISKPVFNTDELNRYTCDTQYENDRNGK